MNGFVLVRKGNSETGELTSLSRSYSVFGRYSEFSIRCVFSSFRKFGQLAAPDGVRIVRSRGIQTETTMGIQGLLPFVEKSTRKVNVSEFSGCTVAVDAYCWLHKGAFSCAEKLARKEETVQYVVYCMKYINMLLSHNIKPILVFDGQHLPAKADTEKVRRERREFNRQKAAELLRADRGDEARVYLRRCVDVTHTMALALIRECRRRNVDCVVAPYEADAQLAYLNLSGIAHLVITEDSDLLPFGCTMVLFKMDVNGYGLLIEQSMLPLAMKQRPEQFSLDKFRYMCILSGCDYLPSLPGIGLAKAKKFITTTSDPDISNALTRLHGHLNMPNLVVTPEYRRKFLEADAMFRHQPVFDPRARRLVPLTPLEPGEEEPLPTDTISRETAVQLAYGNLEPLTLRRVDDWDPDNSPEASKGSKTWQAGRAPHKSIWSPDYCPPKPLPPKKDPRKQVTRPSTKHKQLVQSVDSLKEKIQKVPTLKRASCEEQLDKLKEMYGVGSPPLKKACLDVVAENDDSCIDLDEVIGDSRSPVCEAKYRASNPFRKSPSPRKPVPSSSTSEQPKRLSLLSRLSKIKRTVVDDKTVVKSRYFKSPEEVSEVSVVVEERSQINTSLIVTGDVPPPPALITPQKAVKSTEHPLGASNRITSRGNSPEKVIPPTPESGRTLTQEETTPPSQSSTQRRNIFAVSSIVHQESDFEWNFKKERKSFLNLVDGMGRYATPEGQEEVTKHSSGSFKWSKSLSQGASRENLSALDTSFVESGDGDGGCNLPDTPPSSQGTPPSYQTSISKFIKEVTPRSSKTQLNPAKRVGLSKKRTSTTSVKQSPKAPEPKQTSLLEKFGFQPKSKLRL